MKENIKLKVEMDGEKLFIGDICRDLNRDIYYNVWGKEMNYESGAIKFNNEVVAVVGGTTYGDGLYEDDHLHEFSVDAGVIGVVNLKYGREDLTSFKSSGVIIKVPSGRAFVDFTAEDGVFNIFIGDLESGVELYRGVIDTNQEVEDFDDPEWDEENLEEAYNYRKDIEHKRPMKAKKSNFKEAAESRGKRLMNLLKMIDLDKYIGKSIGSTYRVYLFKVDRSIEDIEEKLILVDQYEDLKYLKVTINEDIGEVVDIVWKLASGKSIEAYQNFDGRSSLMSGSLQRKYNIVEEAMSYFVKDLKIKESKKSSKRRIKEASTHKYSFLICDGNGAASRGGDPDTILQRNVEADNLKDAVIKVFEDLNFDHSSFEDWVEDYYGDEKPEYKTGEELLDDLWDNTDITGGDPWLEGYAIDGKIVKDPDYTRSRIEDGEYVELDDNVDLSFWKIDAPDYDDEYWDDEDYEDEDYDYDESLKNPKRKIKEATSNYKKLFQRLVDDFDIKSGPFAEEEVIATEHGFSMDSQAGSFEVEFDPSTKRWRWLSEYDNEVFGYQGKGWNNLIESLLSSELTLFMYYDYDKSRYLEEE